jgi:hypothetical protein
MAMSGIEYVAGVSHRANLCEIGKGCKWASIAMHEHATGEHHRKQDDD